MAVCVLVAVGTMASADEGSEWSLSLRRRTETAPGTGRYHTLTEKQTWDARRTAFIVCDMWDLHHCLNATRRGGEMAPRMNRVLIAARERGATIIHAPSSCMDAYRDHPARRRAQQTPRAKELPKDIGKWCHRIPAEEKGEYPIDQSDGGEDDDPAEHAKWAKELEAKGRNPRAPWKSQMDAIEIRDADYISDNGEEVWSILEQRGLENVVLVGVHTNMCVLGRPFGLRQMAKNGKNVVLMRDMTDTMYNPQRAPYVSHFTGTDLIVAHIEKFVCPTITSDQIIGGKPFRFGGDKRPHAVVVMAEREYETNRTLPAFALKHLGKEFRVSYVHALEKERNDLPGIEVVRDADVVLLSARRRLLPKAKMELLREHVRQGKALVAVRTSSHAFSVRGKRAPDGLADWPEFDRDVIGGNYTGHWGRGPNVRLEVAPGAGQHEILRGVDVASFVGTGSLYKASPLGLSASALLIGSIEGKAPEPVAWTNRTKHGGRVFYTSLACPKDFDAEPMNRLLRNAIVWAIGGKTAKN